MVGSGDSVGGYDGNEVNNDGVLIKVVISKAM